MFNRDTYPSCSAFIADDEEPTQVLLANNCAEALLYANNIAAWTSDRNTAVLAFQAGGFLVPIKKLNGKLAIHFIHHCFAPMESESTTSWTQDMVMYGILHNDRNNIVLIPQKIHKFLNNNEIDDLSYTPLGRTLISQSRPKLDSWNALLTLAVTWENCTKVEIQVEIQ